MPFDSAQTARLSGASGTLLTLVTADGSNAHRFARQLTTGVAPMRDLADVVHHLCMLHARHPDFMGVAASHSTDPATAEWLAVAASAFGDERAYIVRLVAAAGPLPSTPGQSESEAAVTAQRHALDMLGQSDRRGCADGAAMALALDWPGVRTVLDAAADRLGVTPPRGDLPPAHETAVVADVLGSTAATERAMLFGAQQMLAQHRGLWDLLEARASARDRH